MKTRIDLKSILAKAKVAQKKIQDVIANQGWLDEARALADRQKKELASLISGDVNKLKSFVEQERKALEKLQKEIPSDLSRYKTFFSAQKAEYQKLMKSIVKAEAKAHAEAKAEAGAAKKTSKKTGAKRPSRKKSQ